MAVVLHPRADVFEVDRGRRPVRVGVRAGVAREGDRDGGEGAPPFHRVEAVAGGDFHVRRCDHADVDPAPGATGRIGEGGDVVRLRDVRERLPTEIEDHLGSTSGGRRAEAGGGLVDRAMRLGREEAEREERRSGGGDARGGGEALASRTGRT